MPFNSRLFMFLAFFFFFTACLPVVSSSHLSHHSLTAPSTYTYDSCTYESIPMTTGPSLYRETCIRENFYQDQKSTRAAHLLRADQLWAERFFSGENASGFTVATKRGPGNWISKNESLGTGANYQRRMVTGREGQTYRVSYENPNPKGRSYVDFDDYDVATDALIDVKKSVRTTKKGLDQAQRQILAAQQAGVKKVIWRVPNQAQKLRAEAFFRRKGITGIDVEVVP